jgi:hypothetical protein
MGTSFPKTRVELHQLQQVPEPLRRVAKRIAEGLAQKTHFSPATPAPGPEASISEAPNEQRFLE